MPEKAPVMVEAEWNGGPFDASLLRVPEGAPRVRVLVYRGAVSEMAPTDRTGWTSEENLKVIEVTVPIGVWKGKRWAWWHGRDPRI